MSQLILMIARIDDLDDPVMHTDVWRGVMTPTAPQCHGER